VEAIIQLSMTLAYATVSPKEVAINAPGRVNYHSRYLKLYGDELVYQTKNVHKLKPGDIFITTEGVLCPSVPKGVEVFIWLLADYLGCRDDGIRYISHNQYLSNFTYENKILKLPIERIIHPYISIPIVELARTVAGLDHLGNIVYQKSAIKQIKENIVLTDDDIPGNIRQIIMTAARQAGGSDINMANMPLDKLLQSYQRSKIVIDWCMRGSERCPLEASLFGNIAITNLCSTGMSFTDFPIPPKFLLPYTYTDKDMDTFHEKELLRHLVVLFKDIFHNYWDYVPFFQPLRKSVLDHNPNNMLKETVRFLSTINNNENSSNKTDFMLNGCRGC
jgi:hypothetical protein